MRFAEYLLGGAVCSGVVVAAFWWARLSWGGSFFRLDDLSEGSWAIVEILAAWLSFVACGIMVEFGRTDHAASVLPFAALPLLVLAYAYRTVKIAVLWFRLGRALDELGSDDAEDRRDALLDMVRLRGPWYVAAVAARLSDDDARVRSAAAFALATNPSETAMRLLIEETRSDGTARRVEALRGLAIRRDVRAVPVVGKLLDDKDPGVRLAAAQAIQAFGIKTVTADGVVTPPVESEQGSRESAEDREPASVASPAPAPLELPVPASESVGAGHGSQEAPSAHGTRAPEVTKAMPERRPLPSASEPASAEAPGDDERVLAAKEWFRKRELRYDELGDKRYRPPSMQWTIGQILAFTMGGAAVGALGAFSPADLWPGWVLWPLFLIALAFGSETPIRRTLLVLTIAVACPALAHVPPAPAGAVLAACFWAGMVAGRVLAFHWRERLEGAVGYLTVLGGIVGVLPASLVICSGP